MAIETKLDARGELEGVRVRIDRWRRTRAKRGAMPDALWVEAMALGKRLGVHPVSKHLRLNSDRLKLRLVQSELQLALAKAEPGANSSPGVPAGFVELSAAATPPAGGSAPVVAEVELARPDGAKITFRMAGAQTVDLGDLSDAFFGRGT